MRSVERALPRNWFRELGTRREREREKKRKEKKDKKKQEEQQVEEEVEERSEMEEEEEGMREEAENQYEITLARASAKLQVIKRADKQMKQREARGAASPSKRRKKKRKSRTDEGGKGRKMNQRRKGSTSVSVCAAKQILRGRDWTSQGEKMKKKKNEPPRRAASTERGFRRSPFSCSVLCLIISNDLFEMKRRRREILNICAHAWRQQCI